MLGGLPPLWRLSVQTGVGEERGEKAPRLDEEGGADERGRPPELPMELLLMIRSYLTEKPYSLEKLEGLIKWCAAQQISKVGRCDENVYYEVVTKCIGVPPKVEVPRVPLPNAMTTLGFDDGRSVWSHLFPRDFYDSMAKEMRDQMNEAAKSGKFWRTMMVKCGEELSRLPPSMRGPFLNSNEAQRARWASIFSWRRLGWLKARVVLGGGVDDAPTTHGHDKQSFEDQFPYDSDDWWSANYFVRGKCVKRNFKQRVNGWIEEGWQFDWVLGEVFEQGLLGEVFEKGLDTDELDADELDAWQTRVMKCFKDRVEALVAAGANLEITVSELMGGWPDAREHIAFEKHYVFRFLKLKVDLLLEHNIFVDFDGEYNTRIVFMKLVRCFLQVAPQVESWRRHVGFDEYYDDQAKKARDALFDSYQYELTRELCRLIVHLASPKGSNAHEEARLNMRRLIVQGFFDELPTSGIRPGAWELYDWLRRVDGGFEEWPLIPDLNYVDGVYQGWLGEEP